MLNKINVKNFVLSTIVQLRDIHKEVIVLVEGESDKRLFGNFLSRSLCRILVADGKENVVEALTRYRNKRHDDHRVCGIVDNDYWPVTTGKPIYPSGLFVTDTHDIETMIIRSSAFHKLVSELCDPIRLEVFLKSRGANDLRDVLLSEASKIGNLRLAAILKKADLRFKELALERLIESETLELRVDALYDMVSEHSNVRLSRDTLRAWVQQCIEQLAPDPWILVTGHDVVGVLVVALNEKLSKRSHRKDDLEKDLRLAFERHHFQDTQLYKDLSRWGDAIDVPGFVKN